ncbi:hypothetical protein FKM82_026729 [Ascaphus truei]
MMIATGKEMQPNTERIASVKTCNLGHGPLKTTGRGAQGGVFLWSITRPVREGSKTKNRPSAAGKGAACSKTDQCGYWGTCPVIYLWMDRPHVRGEDGYHICPTPCLPDPSVVGAAMWPQTSLLTLIAVLLIGL